MNFPTKKSYESLSDDMFFPELQLITNNVTISAIEGTNKKIELNMNIIGNGAQSSI